MKEGFKAITSLILAFIVLIPFALLSKYLGGGLIAAFVFTPPYYLLAWKLNMLKQRDTLATWLGIIPLFNVMGVICSDVAKKLLNDFKTFDEKAKESMDGYSYERYQSWTEAFELVSNNGAVSFH